MAELPIFSESDIAVHKSKDDLWINIHGKVYDVSKYVRDHPGGADVLLDVAGTDATAAYEDVGHSEDADHLLQDYLIGHSAAGDTFQKPQEIVLVQQAPELPRGQTSRLNSSSHRGAVLVTVASILLGASVYSIPRHGNMTGEVLDKLSLASHLASNGTALIHNPFLVGFVAASSISAIAAYIVGKTLSRFTHIESGFEQFPAHRKQLPRVEPVNLYMVPGFLNPKEYKGLRLDRIDKLSPNAFRYVFKLPNQHDTIGLPIGQHVSVKAEIDGKTVSRSYTPTSNNLDVGVLELVVKVYPDGELTGKYFANLMPGDVVQFRGPKGAMRYRRGLCDKIGMIAGGTGITPMYQLIRAICEDERDTTEISLVLANRTEEDILLRDELDAFAHKYPDKLKIWYLLDKPPKGWGYGSGYCNAEVIRERLPPCTADTKTMLCGPPGLVNASKRTLVSMGFKEPGAVGSMTDQIFSF
ncbi:hypothetical protein NW762_012133 [Fusarium torreyae]|uniref:Cytochrome b5 reductase n=1 Tax=Fusarium torreyae TaxID=1237075 RepID=A0A9W8RN35_9HYPO|nr:hypothetical protein NW762_012133 [Fusarium torreyae]